MIVRPHVRIFPDLPEARVQFADSVHFKELAELIPLPSAANSKAQAGSSWPYYGCVIVMSIITIIVTIY